MHTLDNSVCVALMSAYNETLAQFSKACFRQLDQPLSKIDGLNYGFGVILVRVAYVRAASAAQRRVSLALQCSSRLCSTVSPPQAAPSSSSSGGKLTLTRVRWCGDATACSRRSCAQGAAQESCLLLQPCKNVTISSGSITTVHVHRRRHFLIAWPRARSQ